MIDFKKFTPSIDINKGKVVFKDVDRDTILSTKVDKVVSIKSETPCYMVSSVLTDGEVAERWIKNGVELDSESDITNNRVVLPMSQWEEEV